MKTLTANRLIEIAESIHYQYATECDASGSSEATMRAYGLRAQLLLCCNILKTEFGVAYKIKFNELPPIRCPKDDQTNAVLDTFPDDDKYFHKVFIVPKQYLIDVLERMDGFNEQKGVNLEQFYEEYIWDETEVIYNCAKKDAEIIFERNE